MTSSTSRLSALAKQRLDAGAFEEATTLARAAIESEPDADAYNVLATACARLGDVHGAEEAFRKAAVLAPELARSHINLATLLARIGRVDDAIESAQRALSVDPTSAKSKGQLAVLLARAGRDDEALPLLEDALAAGTNPTAAAALVTILERQGRLGKALAALDRLEPSANEAAHERRARRLPLLWKLYDPAAAESLAADLGRATPAARGVLEARVHLARACHGQDAPEVLEARADFVAMFGDRASPAAGRARLPASGERLRVVALFTLDALDDLRAWIGVLGALDTTVFEVTVLVERADALSEPAPAHVRVIDVTAKSNREVAQLVIGLGAQALLAPESLGASGRSALFGMTLAPLQYLRDADVLGVAAPLGGSDAAWNAPWPRAASSGLHPSPAEALCVAGLDGPTRWSMQELGLFATLSTRRLVMRGHVDDAAVVRRGLALPESIELELRGATGAALDEATLDGIDVLVCPGEGSVGLALHALARGIAVVAHDGRVAAALRALGLADLVHPHGGPLDASIVRAIGLREHARSVVSTSQALDADVCAQRLASTLLASLEQARSAELEGRAAPPGDRAVPLEGGISIVVPDDPKNMSSYVYREQGRWFEDEVDFVQALLREGDVTLDIGANLGGYALLMANAVGARGRVLAFEPASETSARLRRSVAICDLPQLRVEQCALGDTEGTVTLSHGASPELHQIGAGPGEPVRLARLDGFSDQLRGLSFVKLDAEGFEEPILRGGERLLRREQPLVMFELKHANQVNTRLIDAFAQLGFRSYVYVPALDALAPFEQAGLDGYQLNLFAATPERAATLEHRGRLTSGALLAELRPDRAAALRWFSKRPYSSALQGSLSQMVIWQIMAEDRTRPLAERFTALKRAFDLSNELARRGGGGDPTEQLVAARIQRGAGGRTRAVHLVQAALTRGFEGVEATRTLMPVLARYEELPPRPLAAWLEAQSLEAMLRWQGYSGYFLAPEQSLPLLQRLRATGFMTPSMTRRLSLTLERLGRLD